MQDKVKKKTKVFQKSIKKISKSPKKMDLLSKRKTYVFSKGPWHSTKTIVISINQLNETTSVQMWK